MIPPCLILAAGFGTRMGALTAERPKPLIKVAGRTLLDHAIAAANGAPEIHVNAHYRAAQIVAHLEGRETKVHVESPVILDSGGAVKNVAHHLPDGPLATVNADNVWVGPPPLRTLATAFDPQRMDALLLVVPLDRAVARSGGDFTLGADGRLKLDKSNGTYVYTGAQILDPSRAAEDPREAFSLRDIWDSFAAEGRLFGLPYPGRWADVGHPEGIAAAEAMLEDDRV